MQLQRSLQPYPRSLQEYVPACRRLSARWPQLTRGAQVGHLCRQLLLDQHASKGLSASWSVVQLLQQHQQPHGHWQVCTGMGARACPGWLSVPESGLDGCGQHAQKTSACTALLTSGPGLHNMNCWQLDSSVAASSLAGHAADLCDLQGMLPSRWRRCCCRASTASRRRPACARCSGRGGCTLSTTCPARYICILGAGDAKLEVREEGTLGLQPPKSGAALSVQAQE